jgi:predicted secreted Zn-dependent protease
MKQPTDELRWHRATKCSGGTCVEVAQSDGRILVRDSKNPESIQSYTRAEWDAFINGVKAGEFSFE